MHRDITPANIVISHGGAPCLVDFALATIVCGVRPDFTQSRRLWERWRIWRPSRLAYGPAGWISVPICTRRRDAL